MYFALIVYFTITSSGGEPNLFGHRKFSFSCIYLNVILVLAGKELPCFTCNSADNPNCPMLHFDEEKYTKNNMNCSTSSAETMNSVQRLLYPNQFVETINTLSTSKLTEDRCVKFTASHPGKLP
jgi:hypothetical protein